MLPAHLKFPPSLPTTSKDVAKRHSTGGICAYPAAFGELCAHYDWLVGMYRELEKFARDTEWRYEALQLAVGHLSVDDQSNVNEMARAIYKAGEPPTITNGGTGNGQQQRSAG